MRPVFVILLFNNLFREDSLIKCVFFLSIPGRGVEHAMPGCKQQSLLSPTH